MTAPTQAQKRSLTKVLRKKSPSPWEEAAQYQKRDYQECSLFSERSMSRGLEAEAPHALTDIDVDSAGSLTRSSSAAAGATTGMSAGLTGSAAHHLLHHAHHHLHHLEHHSTRSARPSRSAKPTRSTKLACPTQLSVLSVVDVHIHILVSLGFDVLILLCTTVTVRWGSDCNYFVTNASDLQHERSHRLT